LMDFRLFFTMTMQGQSYETMNWESKLGL
jgi:hypothetical protein